MIDNSPCQHVVIPRGGIADLERLFFAQWDYLPPVPEQGEPLFSFRRD